MQCLLIGVFDTGPTQLALIQPNVLDQAHICRPGKNPGRRQPRIQQRQQRRAVIAGLRAKRRESYQCRQLRQSLMVDGITVPPQPADTANNQGYGHRLQPLAPTDSLSFLGLQASEVGFGKDCLAEQALHKSRVPAIGAGQENPSQTIDGLVAMRGKRHFSEQIHAFTYSCHLLGESQHQPPALDIALLVQSPDQLTIQAL